LTVGVAVITHNAKRHLPNCLPNYLASPLNPKVVVVNSSSNDGTVELAREMGADSLVIPRSEFNHGATREKARKYLSTDIVVMVTPDAYPATPQTLSQLIAPIIAGSASIAYARQLPHDGAGFFEAFPRDFNYPATSHVRSIGDVCKYGVYTFFCSNSCAAYLNSALEEIGGFSSVLLGEDTVAVAKLLRRGHKIAYVAEARVKHSHRYSLKQEFQRSFDTGIARKGYGHLLKTPSTDLKRGTQFMNEMFWKLLTSKPWLLPYAVVQCGVKYAGYLLGKALHKAPITIKKSISSQDFFLDIPLRMPKE